MITSSLASDMPFRYMMMAHPTTGKFIIYGVFYLAAESPDTTTQSDWMQIFLYEQ